MKLFNMLNSRSFKLAFLVALNLSSSFILQITTIYIVGAGWETDTLFLSLSVPVFFISITVGVLNNVLVPYFSGMDISEVNEKLIRIIVPLLLTSLVITLFLLLVIYNGHLLSYYSPIPERVQLLKYLVIVQLPIIPILVVYSSFWSLLNANDKMIESELKPTVFFFLLLPFLIYLIRIYGVWVLSIWFGLRYLILTVNLYLELRKLGVRLCLNEKNNFNSLNGFWVEAKYLFIGAVYYKSEPMIDRVLLSNSNSGVLSLFHLSQQITSAFTQVISRAFVTLSVKKMSEYYKISDFSSLRLEYSNSIIRILKSTVFVVFLAFSFRLLLSFSTVEFLFKSETLTVIDIFLCLSGLLVGSCVGGITSGAFYSVGNTRFVSISAMTIYTISIPIKILFYYYWGFWGLSLSLSMVSLLSMLYFYYSFKGQYFEKSN